MSELHYKRSISSGMTPRYRIAYLLTPIEFGGAEKVSLNFLQTVDRQLFEIHPILFHRPWEGNTFFMKEIARTKLWAYNIPVSLGKNDYLWLVRRFAILLSFLKQNHFDLLHTHGYVADILGILSAKILRIPTISTCHGFIENDRKLSLYNRLDRIALRFSDTIIAVSKDIQTRLVMCGIRVSRIKLIPNAVRTDIEKALFSRQRQETRQRFGLSEKDFVLGYVGRLSPEKGVRYLIEAALLARNVGYPVKLLIMGDGAQQDELTDFVMKWGLESCVIFAGFQNNVDKLLPAIDLFILPSLTEGTPMSLLEAMAYGIPVIASAVGQVPEIIDSGKSGIIVKPASKTDICDAIILLYNDAFFRIQIGKAGQRRVKKEYDIKSWAKRIEAEYLMLVSGTPPSFTEATINS